MKTKLVINTVPLTASEAARLAFFLNTLEDPQNHGRIMVRMNLDQGCRTKEETDQRMQKIEE
jgi:hypothetical protein